jgi:uncharacterized protein (DUF1786 family)
MYAFAAITDTGAVVVWGDLFSGVTEVLSTNRAFAALKGGTGELVLWGNPYHGGDAGAAAAYLSSGVRAVCGNDAAFTAILDDGRAVAWGHATSVPQPGLLSASDASLVKNPWDRMWFEVRKVERAYATPQALHRPEFLAIFLCVQ